MLLKAMMNLNSVLICLQIKQKKQTKNIPGMMTQAAIENIKGMILMKAILPCCVMIYFLSKSYVHSGISKPLILK